MADISRINCKGTEQAHYTGLKNDPSAILYNNAKKRLQDRIGTVDNGELGEQTHCKPKGVNNLGNPQLAGSDSQGDKRATPINVLSQVEIVNISKKTRSGIMTFGNKGDELNIEILKVDRANAQSKNNVAFAYWLRQHRFLRDYVLAHELSQ